MLEFTHTVSKEREGTYYTVPFTVPENTVRVTVSYDYYRPTKGFLADLHPSNTIDIGLMDEKGKFLGWSGSAHSSISVGEYGSSAGYLSEPVNAGEWQIIVGAYHVMPEGVEVKYTVDFEPRRELLLFGDLHIHSTASDGSMEAGELAKLAKEEGLDFIALANHNNFAENLHLPYDDNLTFIPAVEWTHYNGHMNFFGVPAPFENTFIANTLDEMRNIVSHARSLGAVISVNHPKCRFCPYKWEDNESFDMMEIWNGPMRKTNTDGIAWWTELLRSGRKIPAVGGSDFHGPSRVIKLGKPVTAVFSASRSAEDILSAIRSGRSFITSGKDGVRLNLKYGDARMGESVKFSPETKLEASAEKAAGADLVLVTNLGETVLKKNIKDDIIIETSADGISFAYLKAVRGRGICAVTNPLYF